MQICEMRRYELNVTFSFYVFQLFYAAYDALETINRGWDGEPKIMAMFGLHGRNFIDCLINTAFMLQINLLKTSTW